MMRCLLTFAYALTLMISASVEVHARSVNGFDLSQILIDRQEILAGGPPRDGIPSIDHPKFIAVDQVDYLRDDDIVIGVVRGNRQRAYPERILIWHEIVNDTFAGESLVITYCPLCGTAMVFNRSIGGRLRSFGVSGLLYRSDVLMYDRETESLWSQLAMKAVSGSSKGAPLQWLPSEHLTWSAWKQRYPHSEVLSTATGFHRNYASSPYAAYFASDRIMFPVPHKRMELLDKALVIGVIIDGEVKAFPVANIASIGQIKDTIGGKMVTIRYDVAARHPSVTDADGSETPSVVAFWFAWQAFYPKTELWHPIVDE